MRCVRGKTPRVVKLVGTFSGLLVVMGGLVGCSAATTIGSTLSPTSSTSAATATPTPTPGKRAPNASPVVTTSGPAGGWTSYTDSTLGFSVQVPSGWMFDHSAPGDNLWQWQGTTSAGVYGDLQISTISTPDATTQQFCAETPNTTVAGAPAVIADRSMDPAYAPNIQSILERDVVVGGTYFVLSLASNLPLDAAHQQEQSFFNTFVTSFMMPNKITGTVKC